jgi:hypothetical protein
MRLRVRPVPRSNLCVLGQEELMPGATPNRSLSVSSYTTERIEASTVKQVWRRPSSVLQLLGRAEDSEGVLDHGQGLGLDAGAAGRAGDLHADNGAAETFRERLEHRGPGR